MERMPSSSFCSKSSSPRALAAAAAIARTAASPTKFARLTVDLLRSSWHLARLIVVLLAFPAIEVRVHRVADVAHATDEARGIVDAAAARVDGFLRIGAKRPRPIHDSVGQVRSDDALWRDSLFDPFHERAERVEARRASAAGAMEHSGDHEEPVEIIDPRSGAAVLLLEIARDRIVELD